MKSLGRADRNKEYANFKRQMLSTNPAKKPTPELLELFKQAPREFYLVCEEASSHNSYINGAKPRNAATAPQTCGSNLDSTRL
jgi:hypothetical protein